VVVGQNYRIHSDSLHKSSLLMGRTSAGQRRLSRRVPLSIAERALTSGSLPHPKALLMLGWQALPASERSSQSRALILRNYLPDSHSLITPPRSHAVISNGRVVMMLVMLATESETLNDWRSLAELPVAHVDR
jgi:hypothetical protein